MIHGTHDEVVSYEQSEDMYDELQDADATARYVEIKKADHYLSNGAHRMEALRAIDSFVKKHIQ